MQTHPCLSGCMHLTATPNHILMCTMASLLRASIMCQVVQSNGKDNRSFTASPARTVSAAKTARSVSAFARSMRIPGMSPYTSPVSLGFASPLSPAAASRSASTVSGTIPGLSVYRSLSPSRVTSSGKAADTGSGSPLAAWSKAKASQPPPSKQAVSTGNDTGPDAFSFRVATALQFESPGQVESPAQSRTTQLAAYSSRPLTVCSPHLLHGSSRFDEEMFLGTLRLAAASDSLLHLADATPGQQGECVT